MKNAKKWNTRGHFAKLISQFDDEQASMILNSLCNLH